MRQDPARVERSIQTRNLSLSETHKCMARFCYHSNCRPTTFVWEKCVLYAETDGWILILGLWTRMRALPILISSAYILKKKKRTIRALDCQVVRRVVRRLRRSSLTRSWWARSVDYWRFHVLPYRDLFVLSYDDSSVLEKWSFTELASPGK